VSDIDGIQVLNEDWDNLLILDAFRYDTFHEIEDGDGELTAVNSAGTNSLEYIEANFDGKCVHDTVYITANPYAEYISNKTFHKVEKLYLKEWSEEHQTVLPSSVINNAVRICKNYPNKRIIVHFMQPHAPFIGETKIEHNIAHSPNEDIRSIWTALRYGLRDIKLDKVKSAYNENARIAYNAAAELANKITGKTVITSDHGELLGNRLWPLPVRGYGHTAVPPVPQIRTVPWYVLKDDVRKKIVSEPPVDQGEETHDIDSQLSALGYIQ